MSKYAIPCEKCAFKVLRHGLFKRFSDFCLLVTTVIVNKNCTREHPYHSMAEGLTVPLTDNVARIAVRVRVYREVEY